MNIRKPLLAFTAMMALSLTGVAQDDAGTVSGVVYDLSTGDVMRGVQVTIIATDLTTRTDLDGAFRIEVPAGTYQIRATTAGYISTESDGLIIAPNRDAIVDLVLRPESDLAIAGTEITVNATTIEAATQEAMLLERRSAPTVSDIISSQEISGNGDSDAAAAVSRSVGVSVMDGKYVYVRGLGDRFSTTQLNGSLLPSTETDKKVVPLDLFPANLIDSIKLEKTFTPDRPGEFSGGLVRIETVEFPVRATLNVSMSQGFNSQTTFKDYLDYPGGNYDWLGFGDSRRHLPEAIPFDRVVRTSIFTPRGYEPEQIEAFGESFENVWSPVTKSRARPNQSWSLLAGSTFGKFGIVYALSYGNSLQNDRIEQNYYRVDNDAVAPIHEYDMTLTTNSVRLGNTLNFAYKLSDNHKILFKNFLSKDMSDEARTYVGSNGDFNTTIRNQRLRFVEESLYSGQVAGEHFLPGLNSLVEWRIAYNRGDRDEPDIREALYILNQATGEFRLREQTQSGLRHFIASTDKLWEPAVDFSRFFIAGRVNGTIKGGGTWTVRDRFFYSRRFRFTHRRSTGLDLSQSPETLFSPEFIGPNFEVREDTRVTDHYTGEQEIRAGYGMVDLNLGSRLRLIGGIRVEQGQQTLDSFDLFDVDPETFQTRLDDTDVLPGINVVYSLTPRMNIRGAFSKTLSRPNFRELAPFEFTEVTGGNSVVGNENLVRTKINNADLRWEWFTGPTDLVSVSVFYKNFANPIEQILEPTAQLRIRFDNVEQAENWGVETELRQSLGRLIPSLGNFSISGNYTFVSSEVEIGDRLLSVVTSTTRPLAGQSRHVFNTAFEFANGGWGHSSRLLYNMVGRRIYGVGAVELPDIYEEAQHVVDFVLRQRIGDEESPLELKFSVDNLLNDKKEFTQGGLPYRVYRKGRGFSVGVSYQFF